MHTWNILQLFISSLLYIYLLLLIYLHKHFLLQVVKPKEDRQRWYKLNSNKNSFKLRFSDFSDVLLVLLSSRRASFVIFLVTIITIIITVVVGQSHWDLNTLMQYVVSLCFGSQNNWYLLWEIYIVTLLMYTIFLTTHSFPYCIAHCCIPSLHKECFMLLTCRCGGDIREWCPTHGQESG